MCQKDIGDIDDNSKPSILSLPLNKQNLYTEELDCGENIVDCEDGPAPQLDEEEELSFTDEERNMFGQLLSHMGDDKNLLKTFSFREPYIMSNELPT